MKEKNFTTRSIAAEITVFVVIDIALGFTFGTVIATRPSVLATIVLGLMLIFNVGALYANIKAALELQNAQGRCDALEELCEEYDGLDEA